MKLTRHTFAGVVFYRIEHRGFRLDCAFSEVLLRQMRRARPAVALELRRMRAQLREAAAAADIAAYLESCRSSKKSVA